MLSDAGHYKSIGWAAEQMMKWQHQKLIKHQPIMMQQQTGKMKIVI